MCFTYFIFRICLFSFLFSFTSPTLLHPTSFLFLSRPSFFSIPFMLYESFLDIYHSQVLLYPHSDHFLYLRLTCAELKRPLQKNLVLVVSWLNRYPYSHQARSFDVNSHSAASGKQRSTELRTLKLLL